MKRYLAFAALLGILLSMTGIGWERIGPPTGSPGILLYPGDVIQDSVDAYPAGTTFTLMAGVHRVSARITPLTGNVFLGQTNAAGELLTTMSGAALVADSLWQYDAVGDVWWFPSTQPNFVSNGQCERVDAESTACRIRTLLFFDDYPLTHVANRGSLDAEHEVYFDATNDSVIVKKNPWGHKVEFCGNLTGFMKNNSADSVTVRNLVIEKFPVASSGGALSMGNNSTKGWLVEDCEIRLNSSGGLEPGRHGIARNNYIHHNGQIGIVGSGDSCLVYGNEIAYNNILHFAPGWEAGGTKFTTSDSMTVRQNTSHHNYGVGIWFDVDNRWCLMDSNTCYDNYYDGIFYEISYGPAAITANTCYDNSKSSDLASFLGANIRVSTSDSVEVSYNTVYGGIVQGICGYDNGDSVGAFGNRVLKELNVHHNTITMNTNYMGIARGAAVAARYGDSLWDNFGNRFDNNTYTLLIAGSGGDSTYWYWKTNAQYDDVAWVAANQDTGASSSFTWE